MTLTIMRDSIYGSEKILVGSRDARFREHFGGAVVLGKECWLTNLEEIAYWINNELKEDCLYEVS